MDSTPPAFRFLPTFYLPLPCHSFPILRTSGASYTHTFTIPLPVQHSFLLLDCQRYVVPIPLPTVTVARYRFTLFLIAQLPGSGCGSSPARLRYRTTCLSRLPHVRLLCVPICWLIHLPSRLPRLFVDLPPRLPVVDAACLPAFHLPAATYLWFTTATPLPTRYGYHLYLTHSPRIFGFTTPLHYTTHTHTLPLLTPVHTTAPSPRCHAFYTRLRSRSTVCGYLRTGYAAHYAPARLHLSYTPAHATACLRVFQFYAVARFVSAFAILHASRSFRSTHRTTTTTTNLPLPGPTRSHSTIYVAATGISTLRLITICSIAISTLGPGVTLLPLHYR